MVKKEQKIIKGYMWAEEGDSIDGVYSNLKDCIDGLSDEEIIYEVTIKPIGKVCSEPKLIKF